MRQSGDDFRPPKNIADKKEVLRDQLTHHLLLCVCVCNVQTQLPSDLSSVSIFSRLKVSGCFLSTFSFFLLEGCFNVIFFLLLLTFIYFVIFKPFECMGF